MTEIFIPTAETVVEINKFLCLKGGNPHHCEEIGKIESAISTAFYPGAYPFAHGDIVAVAAALCFYLVKSHAFVDGNKRTGALTSIVFLNQQGLDLGYSKIKDGTKNELATVIEKCAASQITIEQLKIWFEAHKVKL